MGVEIERKFLLANDEWRSAAHAVIEMAQGYLNDAEAVTLSDEEAGRYRRLWLREGRLVGAVLYGDTADAPFYLDLIAGGRPVASFRARLAFGAAYAEAA